METDTWQKAAIPSTSQTCRDSGRSDNELHDSSILFHSDLPGSVSDFYGEFQAQPSCRIKSIAIDNDSVQSPEEKGEGWLNKIGIFTRKLRFLKCWKVMNEATREPERDIHRLQNPHFGENCSPRDLAECDENEGQPYIPYELAKMYIAKIVKDVQEMKLNHMLALKEMEENAKRNQEQDIFIIKNNYRDKMKALKTRLQSYYEIMEQKTHMLQEKIKNLEKEKEQLMKEKAALLLEIQDLKEKLGQEEENKNGPECQSILQKQVIETEEEEVPNNVLMI